MLYLALLFSNSSLSCFIGSVNGMLLVNGYIYDLFDFSC